MLGSGRRLVQQRNMATTPGSGGLEFDPAAAGGAGGSTTRGTAQGTQVRAALVCMLLCLAVGRRAQLVGPPKSAAVHVHAQHMMQWLCMLVC